MIKVEPVFYENLAEARHPAIYTQQGLYYSKIYILERLEAIREEATGEDFWLLTKLLEELK